MRCLEPATRPRRLVLLFDVSGSMEPYARALVRFLHAAVVGRGRGRGVRARHPAHADHARAVVARSRRRARAPPRGGWPTGRAAPGSARASRAFNDRWGVRGMARGAVVVILSDGWDRGDPGVLAEQMAPPVAGGAPIVWVNPLKASPGYAPLARGMAAALPYVDEFVEGHSLAALEELAEVISK